MLRRSTRHPKRRLSTGPEPTRLKFHRTQLSSDKPSEHETVDDLCTACDRIRSKIVNKPLSGVNEQGIVICDDLPSPSVESCALCQYISHSIKCYQLERNTSFELRLFSSRKSFFWLYQSHAKYLDTVGMLAIVPQPSVTREEMANFVRNRIPEFLMPSCPSPFTSSISCRGRNAMGADFDFIRESLSYCDRHHRCHQRAHFNQGRITLLDCRTKTTTDVNFPCRYIALSYVWGDSGRNKEETLTGQDQRPQVIEDVINVAKQLNINYVWVDKYCIDQQNPDRKRQQLRNMHAIYQNAYLTVVDGAGSDMHSGLAGISKTRAGNQIVVQLGGQSWVSTLGNPEILVQNSTWNSRGWTYQEAIASPRLLIFTEEQVYFECKGMRYWETVRISLDSHHQKDKSRFRRFLREPVFCQETQFPAAFEGRNDFPRYIEDFSHRTLTHGYDALNAIQGVLHFLEIIPGGEVFNFWGIPLYAPNPHYSPSALTSGMAWTMQSQEDTPSKLVLRRRGFPSWSWAGWECIVGSFELGYLNHYTSPVSIKIQSRKDDETPIPWVDFWRAEGGMKMGRRTNLWASGLGANTGRKDYDYPWLDITTGTIKVQLVYFSHPESERSREIGFPIKSGFYVCPHDKDKDSGLTPVDLPEDYLELNSEGEKKEICRREWEGILLGYTPGERYEGKDFPCVILLNHCQRWDVTERVWGGRLNWANGWEKFYDLEPRRVRLY